MKYDALGIRMKGYEDVTNTKLVNRLPIIIRLDGKAFHTFTKGFEKPYDTLLNDCMQNTMKYLCENISNCVFGYTQSDEITLVLFQKTRESEPWFDNRIQKLCSISAALATMQFNKLFAEAVGKLETISNMVGNSPAILATYKKSLSKGAFFDARVFNLPQHEVVNNIIWRQQDATKNSIASLAQANFSHKELQGKNTSQMQDMLMLVKGINWNNAPTVFKRGCACIRDLVEIDTPNGKVYRNKWVLDTEMPIITQNKEYIEKLLKEID